MKIKRIWAIICSALACVCMALGIGFTMNSRIANAETTFTEVDITNDIRVHYWDGNETKGYQFMINVYTSTYQGYNIHGITGDGLNGQYFNETPDVNGCDIMSYIQVNGVTLRSVVGANGISGSQANGGLYTSTNSEFGANAKYAPFRLRTIRSSAAYLNAFDLYISADYVESVVGGLENLEITVLSGIEWKTKANVNGVNHLMKTTKNRTFEMTAERMTPSASASVYLSQKLEKVDVTDVVGGLTVSPFDSFYSISGMSIGSETWSPLTGSATMYLNDNAATNGCDLASYILVNGVTARSIMSNNAGYTQNTSVSSWAGAAFRPILVTVDRGVISIEITKEYLQNNNNNTLNGLEITLKSGFEWKNSNGKVIYTTKDITWIYSNDAFEVKREKVDITDTVGGLTVSPFDSFYSISGMNIGSETWSPLTGSATMYLNDNAATNGCDLASYILVNGVTARSIMSNNAGYTQNTSVSSWAGAAFRPILVTVDRGVISIEITKEYLQNNNNNTLNGLEITLKSGFEWKNSNGKVIYTTKDITWIYSNNTFEVKRERVDIANTVGGLTVSPFDSFYSISGMSIGSETWSPLTGSATMYLNDNAATNGCDLASYILVNGVSARSIMNNNAEYTQNTSVSSWAGAAFRPILVTVDGDVISIEITKEYLQKNNNNTLNGLEITLKSGFEWKNSNGKVIHTTADITWIYLKNSFIVKPAAVDVTNDIGGLTVSPFDDFYSIGGMKMSATTWAPYGIAKMYLNDNVYTNGCDLASYILINGVNARSVMSNNAGYTQNTSVSSWAGAAFRPIVITVDGDVISIEITKEYLQKNNNDTLNGLEITLKSGFEWANNDGQILQTTKDITWKYVNDSFVESFVSNVSVSCQDSLDLNFYVTARGEVSGVWNDNTENVNGVYDEQTGLMKFTCPVAAKDWEENMTLTLDNGTVWTMSVKNYLDRIPADNKAYSVAVAVKEYCAAAATYFMQGEAIATEALSDEEVVALEAKKAVVEGEQEGVTLTGLTVELESKTNLRIYFKADNIAAIDCKVNGVSVIAREWAEGCYVIVIENITATELDTDYTVKIGGYTVTCSALSYVALTHNSADVAYANVVKALYLYNVAAEAYFN